MNYSNMEGQTDHGPAPYVANITQKASKNRDFRNALWTGTHLQMTLMSIPPFGEIGAEVHEDTDQLIRVEQGNGVVKMYDDRKKEQAHLLCTGDAVFVPAGTRHNVINTARIPLKLSSVYAPPNHPRGTVEHTKEETY